MLVVNRAMSKCLTTVCNEIISRNIRIFLKYPKIFCYCQLASTSLAGFRMSLAAVLFAEHVFVHVQVFTAALKDQDYQMLTEINQLLFGSVFDLDSLEQYDSITGANFL